MWSSQKELPRKRLIVGLGNPGPTYEKTRHNLGSRIVRRLALLRGLSFDREIWAKGLMAEGDDVFLLLPMTWMNLSGTSVLAACRRYGLHPAECMIVSDDVDLPFGTVRKSDRGGHGGHNGLRNIEQSLGSKEYPRLRVGVGRPSRKESLETYVLESFTEQELKALSSVEEEAIAILEEWLNREVERKRDEKEKRNT